MRIDLISSATVADRAVKFVDRNKGLIPLDKKVTMDDTKDSVQDIMNTNSSNYVAAAHNNLNCSRVYLSITSRIQMIVTPSIMP